jgi:hypothetical protein
MGHLARLCEDHPEVALDVFEFLEGLLVRKDTISEIENAVAISFLDWERVQRLDYSCPPTSRARSRSSGERDQQGIRSTRPKIAEDDQSLAAQLTQSVFVPRRW